MMWTAAASVLTTALAFTLLAPTAMLGLTVIRGSRRLASLAAGPVPRRPHAVTIVVAARNEADAIGGAVRSLLAQRHLGALRVIVVDDRSDDETSSILAEIAANDPHLETIRIEELPDDWLGKNHALWTGARTADSDWLLFTDADVYMAEDAVARAIGTAEAGGLDHVTVMPQVEAQPALLRILIIQFGLSFLGYFRPWRLGRDPECFAGIGAFNLVRRDAYQAAGGHRAIALTPLDDMFLGRILNRAGARSVLLTGESRVRVRWYPSPGAMIRAFGKNGFAAFDYRVHRLALLTGAVALLGLGPWLGLLAPDPLARALFAVTAALGVSVHAWFAARSGWPLWTGLLAPVGTVLSLWMWWRASVLALRRGAVEWRGTRYSLARLRAHHDELLRR